MSHDTLAQTVGSSRQHMIRLEKGQHQPRPEMRARIADALGDPSLTAGDDDEEDDAEMVVLGEMFLELLTRVEAMRSRAKGAE